MPFPSFQQKPERVGAGSKPAQFFMDFIAAAFLRFHQHPDNHSVLMKHPIQLIALNDPHSQHPRKTS